VSGARRAWRRQREPGGAKDEEQRGDVHRLRG